MSILTEAYQLHELLVGASSKDDVLKIMKGASGMAFIELDSRPGQFPGDYNNEDWYMWLRQLRNDPNSGLFEGFAQ